MDENKLHTISEITNFVSLERSLEMDIQNNVRTDGIMEQKSKIASNLDIASLNRDMSICNQPQQAPVEVSYVRNLTELIPETDRAINGPVIENMEQYEKQGLFNPTINMAQIKHICDDRIFAYIRKLADGSREIRFVERYPDGSYSPEFDIKQSDLLEVITWQKYQDSLMERDAKRTLRKIQKNYLDKCCGMEIQSVGQIIRALAEALKYLPVVSDTGEMTSVQLYSEVICAIKERCDGALKYNRREGYIILTEDDVSCIAEVLSMSERALLSQLKKYKLLYLSDSCLGYQTKVPSYRGENGRIVYEWCYCLLDMEYYSRKLDPARKETAKNLATSFVGEMPNTTF